jgi:hypothetical protein
MGKEFVNLLKFRRLNVIQFQKDVTLFTDLKQTTGY